MGGSLFARLGRFAARRRWIVIPAWIVALVVMGTFAKGLQGRLSSGGFEVPGSDSLSVSHDLSRSFSRQYPLTALVVVRNATATLDDAAFKAEVQSMASEVRGVENVGAVYSFYNTGNQAFVSADRHTTFILVGLKGTQSDALDASGAVAAAARKAAGPGFTVKTGGVPAFFNRFNEVSRQDLEKAEKVSFPLTLVVLLIAFGTLVAAGLPIMLGIVSLVVTLGALYFLAGVTDMSIYVTNTASIIGIGVGIDYSLFVVTRFREELRRGQSVHDAVVQAVANSGRAVALSGATVVVALFGMFLVNIQAFRSMAIGSMSVVAVAVLGAVTLLPAVLSTKVGSWIDRVRLPFTGRRQANPDRGFWHRWAVAVMRRPWAALALSAAILLVLAAPFTAIRLGQPGPSVLPRNEEPRVATEMLAREFGAGVTGPVEILVDSSGGALAPDNLAKVDRLTQRLKSDPEVVSVQSLTSIVPGKTLADYRRMYAGGLFSLPRTMIVQIYGLADWDLGAGFSRITAITRHDPTSVPAERLIDRIRHDYVAQAGLSGHARVGGSTAFNLDLEREISHRLPLVVGVVLALSFVLLMMAFRSLLLPLKAIVMNLLSVGAAYGSIVVLFQWGWGSRLLGFESNGHIEVFVPLFLFSILFGLSMDYEVFLMSRMREEYYRTGSNELAVAHGLESTARTITSAALIMVTVFVAFAASRVVPFKEMGVGLAVAVFIDATLVRTILVPAAMKLMGDWNWWMPRWLEARLPRIGLESGAEDPGEVELGGAALAPETVLVGES